MTRTLRVVLAGVLAAVLAGCAQSGGSNGGVGGPPATTPPATATVGDGPPSPPGPPGEEAPPVLPDGRSPVILKAVDVAHRTITFDLVELYLGTQAAVEWKKDHPGQTEVPPLNGHYMRNNNPKLRTLPVAPDAVIKVLNESGDPSNTTTITLAKLATYHSLRGIYWITVAGGTVTAFDEQFFP